MNIIVFLVYGEDNTKVFVSQVLEMAKKVQESNIVAVYSFMNYRNNLKKKQVTKLIAQYCKIVYTRISFPILTFFQISFSIRTLRKDLRRLSRFDKISIVCRGEISTFVAIEASKNLQNIEIIYDNRGLPIEEKKLVNRFFLTKQELRIRRKIISIASQKCDKYLFVSSRLREYLLDKYAYDAKKPFLVIPTLTKELPKEKSIVKSITGFFDDDSNIYMIYAGSSKEWQSIEVVFEVFRKIQSRDSRYKLIFLSPNIVEIPLDIRENVFFDSVSPDIVKQYLAISSFGFVVRDENVINYVSAPTKLTEYLFFDLYILYDTIVGSMFDLLNIDPTIIDCFFNVYNDDFVDKLFLVQNKKAHYSRKVYQYLSLDERANDLLKFL